MKKVVVCVFLFLFLISSVFAIKTNITIETYAGTRVILRVLDPETLDTLSNGMFNQIAGDNGRIQATYYGPEKKICLSTFIKDDPDGFNKFKKDSLDRDIETGGEIYINLNLGTPKAVVSFPEEEAEESVAEENETQDLPAVQTTEKTKNENEAEDKEDKPLITGGAITGNIKSHVVYYTVGFILFIGILLLFVMRKHLHLRKRQSEQPFSVKLSEIKNKSSDDRIATTEKQLAEAEEKLKQVKAEIDSIKNKKSKLTEAQQKFEKARQELEQAKKEQDL